MEKSIALKLNRFSATPSTLLDSPPGNTPRVQIVVNLASLFHHYWLDSFGRVPPDPDPANFEHVQFLLPIPEFRIRGEGIGISTVIKQHRSNELGQAFCRWFLHDHLDITYFAHMKDVLDKQLPKDFGKGRIERASPGDTPDYLCAKNANEVFLAEAKGRYESVSFASADFVSWRKQFDRVVVRDRSGVPRGVKGFIVATRYATESKPKVKTTLFAEDPETSGEGGLREDDVRLFGSMIISAHYAEIAQKLNQQILAMALRNAYIVPAEIGFPLMVWQFRGIEGAPLEQRRFVGGYYSGPGALPIHQVNGEVRLDYLDPFRLDVSRGTLFGVDEKIFEQVTRIARQGLSAAAEIRQFEYTQPFFSGVSALRDGSIIAPIEFFVPIGQRTF